MATHEDVLRLMEFLAAEFSTFQVTAERASIWMEMLGAFSPEQLLRGAKHFLLHSGSEFGPTLPQLVQAIRDSTPRPERVVRPALPAPETTHEERINHVAELRAQFPNLFQQRSK